MDKNVPLQYNTYLEFAVDIAPDARKWIVDELVKKIGGNLPEGVSVVPVIIGQGVELKIAFDSGRPGQKEQPLLCCALVNLINFSNKRCL